MDLLRGAMITNKFLNRFLANTTRKTPRSKERGVFSLENYLFEFMNFVGETPSIFLK